MYLGLLEGADKTLICGWISYKVMDNYLELDSVF